MEELAERYVASEVEEAARTTWTERSLPGPSASIGPPSGRPIVQFPGTVGSAGPEADRIAPAIVADAIARFEAIRGRRTSFRSVLRRGTLPATVAARRELGERLAAWSTVSAPLPVDDPDPRGRVQVIVEQLARRGLVALRRNALLTCPACRAPRSPQATIYESTKGSAYLLRFPLRAVQPRTSLLVWGDAPWKLVGTSAILVHPKLTYVTASFRRRGNEERVVLLKSSVPKLAEWLPEGEIEVLEERTGAELSGTAYIHPLTDECRFLNELAAPEGTILTSAEVTDSGSGIVPLVPQHGAADAAAARHLGIVGREVLGQDGRLSRAVRHKYEGLEREAADAFILRDLQDSGAIFAELTVRRGVPHCAVCGRELLWVPSKNWCVEFGRLPESVRRDFARFRPEDRLRSGKDPVPWPLSEGEESVDPLDPQLGECDACERLAPPSASGRCSCGGTVRHIRRRLLPAFGEVALFWAGIGEGEGTIVLAPERRAGPALVHHLIAREAAGVGGAELRWRSVARLSGGSAELPGPSELPADALRVALLVAASPGRRCRSLRDLAIQEARRLRRLWEFARMVMEGLAGSGPAEEPTAGAPVPLPEEDRAFFARFERSRARAVERYEALDPAGAHELLARFMETEILGGFLPILADRLGPKAAPGDRARTLRMLARVLSLWSELYAPLAPFTVEAIGRQLFPEPKAVIERSLTPIEPTVTDAALEARYLRWLEFAATLRSARLQVGLPADAIIPRVVLFVSTQELLGELEAAAPVLARIGRVGAIDFDSPERPWEGRRIECRPVLAEIRRVYGSRAARIVHLLERMPGRSVLAGMEAEKLSVVLDGEPVQILPSMVEFEESLPDCVVPAPWALGEIVLVDPLGTKGAALPALSLEGFALARHIRRRVARARLESPPTRALIAASGSLAHELGEHLEALSALAGVPSIELSPDDSGFSPSQTSSGRTRRGERWRVWIPGLFLPPPRRKSRPTRGRSGRLGPFDPVTAAPEPTPDELAERATRLAELHDQLVAALGRPLIGPAKVAAAWEAGFRSLAELEAGDYDRLGAIAGFGPFAAGELLRVAGRPVPSVPRAAPLPDELASGTRPGAEVLPVASPSVPEPIAATSVGLPGAPGGPSSGPLGGDVEMPADPTLRPRRAPPARPGPQVPQPRETLRRAPRAAPTSTAPADLPAPDLRAPPMSDGAADLPSPAEPIERPREGDGSPLSPDESTGSAEAPPPAVVASLPAESGAEEAPIVMEEAGEFGGESTGGEAAPPEPPEPPEPPAALAVVPAPSATETTLPPEQVAEPSVPERLVPPESDEVASVAPEPSAPAPAPDTLASAAPGDRESAPEQGEVLPTPPLGTGSPTTPADLASALEQSEVVPEAAPEPDAPVGSADLVGSPERAELPEDATPVPPTPASELEIPQPGSPSSTDSPAPPAPSPESLASGVASPGPTDAVAAPTEPAASASGDPLTPPATNAETLAPGETSDSPAYPADSAARPPTATEAPIGSGPPAEPSLTAPAIERTATDGSPAGPTDLSVGASPPTPSVPVRHDEAAIVGAIDSATMPAPAEPTIAGEIAPPAAIEPPPAAPAVPQPSPPEPAAVEFLEGVDAVRAWPRFLGLTQARQRGLCLTREPPETRRREIGERDVEIVWLSNILLDPSTPTARPGDLDALELGISRAIDTGGVDCVLLEGLEYLTMLHGAERVLGFLERIGSVARRRGAVLLLPFEPRIVSRSEAVRITERFGSAGPSSGIDRS